MKKLKTTFGDRLEAAADAKKAMLAKFKPLPTVIDPDFDKREAEREAEREAIRTARAAERQAKKDALAQAEQARLDAEAKAREDADHARKSSQRAELMAMYGRKRR
ncbi:MAG: hypothetical protein JWO72_672 [Caulobacteraceae bacterium]|nr:hypothetical protein [Caulobacteraceae bacterium]